MKFEAIDGNEVRREALALSAQHFSPDKLAVFVASLPQYRGTGRDYILERDKLFEGETVESLVCNMDEWKKNQSQA